MKDIAIIGSGGLGKETAVLIHQINEQGLIWNLTGFYDDGINAGRKVVSSLELGKIEELNKINFPLCVVVAIGEPAVKRKIVQQIQNPHIKFPVLVHPTATVGLNIKLGEGTVIAAGCRLTTDINIGSHVLMNLNTTVGHDVAIGNFCSIMPGVHLSGNVKIGESVLIGTGASILQQIEIKSLAVVGAGAVVNRSVNEGTTVAGVPARAI